MIFACSGKQTPKGCKVQAHNFALVKDVKKVKHVGEETVLRFDLREREREQSEGDTH